MSVTSVKALHGQVPENGMAMGSVDWGGMSVISHRWPAGLDVTPVLQAAVGDLLCQVPHYFYCISGAFTIRYTDNGSEEGVKAGDVAYARPGHTLAASEDSEVLEISSADLNHFLMARIQATGLLG